MGMVHIRYKDHVAHVVKSTKRVPYKKKIVRKDKMQQMFSLYNGIMVAVCNFTLSVLKYRVQNLLLFRLFIAKDFFFVNQKGWKMFKSYSFHGLMNL